MANVYKRGPVWWGRATHQGKEYRYSLDTPSRAVAQERLAKWVTQLKASKWGERPRRTFDETVRKFTSDYLPRLKPRSRDRYLDSLLNLANSFHELYLDDISSARLSDFETKRRREGVQPGTIRRDLACLSSVFRCAEGWEYHQGNPAAAYLRQAARRGLKEAPPRTRYLSHEEEGALLGRIATKRAVAKGRRDQHALEMLGAAVAFAIDTGLRKEEQLAITWREIDLDRLEVIVPDERAKSGVGRRVPILPRTAALLRAIPRHSASPYVFWNRDGQRYFHLYLQLTRLADKLEITDLRWHDLRRTCGCRLLQDYGFTLEKVCLWLGHSSVSVTEKAYAFLEVRHLHEAVKIGAQKSAHLTLIEAPNMLEIPDKSRLIEG